MKTLECESKSKGSTPGFCPKGCLVRYHVFYPPFSHLGFFFFFNWGRVGWTSVDVGGRHW